MTRLLRAEFKKLFWTKTLWVCLILSAASALLAVGSFWLLDVIYKGDFSFIEIQGAYGDMFGNIFSVKFSGVFFLAGTNTQNSPVLLIAILSAIFITGDFSSGSIKNSIARGYGRTEWYLSKLVVAAAAACLISLAGTVIATLAATIIWGFGSLDMTDFFNLMMSFISQLAVILATVAVFVCISIFFRTTGAAVAVCVISTMSLSLVLTVIDLLLRLDFSLAKFELTTMLVSVSTLSPRSGDVIRALAASAAYAAAATAAGLTVFKKRDI